MPRIISIQLLVNDFGNLGSPIQQASIYPAVQNMLLAARALGLGATLTTLYLQFEKEAEAALGLPSGVHSYALLPIGYPLGGFGAVRRIALADVVFEDRWGPRLRGPVGPPPPGSVAKPTCRKALESDADASENRDIGWLLANGREHVPLHHNFPDDLRRAICTGIHSDNKVQVRHDIDTLPTITETGNPADFPALDQKAPQPP
jgi:hypothetical protein